MQIVDVEPGDPRLVDDVLPVLQQLRPQITASTLQSVYEEGHPQGLRFSAGYLPWGTGQHRCVAVAGWRIMATTACVRKLYVDDLVTAADQRSRGTGRAMLAELTRRAESAGCAAIDLDSNTNRLDAHRFYMREHYAIVSFHFARFLG